jgi:hypothetical protein
MQLALSLGLDWLLHIDADELFYPGPLMDVPAHFGELYSESISTFCYKNHEAVPERHDVVDPFREVSLFKRSLDDVPYSKEAETAVAFWQARQEGSFFYYYDNGKAAVRVHVNARPLSVHEFLPGRPDDMLRWRSNLRSPWPERGNLGSVVQYRASDACVLHFPCCNADALWLRWLRGNDNCARAFARSIPVPPS